MKFKIYHTKERIERAKNWLLKFYTKEKISCLVDFINEFFFVIYQFQLTQHLPEN